MLFFVLVLFLSLGLLVKASDMLIESSAKLARFLNISELVIGLTLVAIGTSVPELASCVLASLHGSGDLVIGNVVGSNVANIGIVLGLSLLFSKLVIDKEVVKRDSMILLFASFLLIVVLLGNVVSRLEGLFLLLLFIAYFNFLFRTKKRYRLQYGFSDFLQYFIRSEYLQELTEEGAKIVTQVGQKIVIDKRILKTVATIFFSGILVVVSAELLVSSALKLSTMLNINASFIGITLIAIGTSLPELSVPLRAIKKYKRGILFGTIIGSGITNIFFVVALSAFVAELNVYSILLTSAIAAFLSSLLFGFMTLYK